MGKKGYRQSPEWIRKRVESRKGYHPSEESLKKMREAKLGSKNPMYGKQQTEESKAKFKASRAGYKHSEETKQKLRDSRLKFYKNHPERIEELRGKNNPMYGKRGPLNPMFGKHLSDGARRKISQSRVGRFAGSQNSFFGRHHSEQTRQKMREMWKGRSFKERDNKLEVKLQKALVQNGIEFRTHENLPGRPDIFVEPKLCIFVDGCYWHGCSCKFDQNQKGRHADYIKTRMAHDKEINKILSDSGFKILRLWEHEINASIDDCINRVLANTKIPIMMML